MKKIFKTLSGCIVAYALLYTIAGILLSGGSPTPQLDRQAAVQEGFTLPGVQFLDVVHVKGTPAALMMNAAGQTALLTRTPIEVETLAPAQQLAVAVLATHQPSYEDEPVAKAHRFKNLKTGEFKEFTSTQYPTSGEWVRQ